MFKCPKCIKPDEKPIRYFLNECDSCGATTGVAEVEYRPQVIDDLFKAFKY
jgi:translation initiation factor 2 beta subunit (eIF-2beta)/eIF-5